MQDLYGGMLYQPGYGAQQSGHWDQNGNWVVDPPAGAGMMPGGFNAKKIMAQGSGVAPTPGQTPPQPPPSIPVAPTQGGILPWNRNGTAQPPTAIPVAPTPGPQTNIPVQGGGFGRKVRAAAPGESPGWKQLADGSEEFVYSDQPVTGQEGNPNTAQAPPPMSAYNQGIYNANQDKAQAPATQGMPTPPSQQAINQYLGMPSGQQGQTPYTSSYLNGTQVQTGQYMPSAGPGTYSTATQGGYSLNPEDMARKMAGTMGDWRDYMGEAKGQSQMLMEQLLAQQKEQQRAIEFGQTHGLAERNLELLKARQAVENFKDMSSYLPEQRKWAMYADLLAKGNSPDVASAQVALVEQYGGFGKAPNFGQGAGNIPLVGPTQQNIPVVPGGAPPAPYGGPAGAPLPPEVTPPPGGKPPDLNNPDSVNHAFTILAPDIAVNMNNADKAKNRYQTADALVEAIMADPSRGMNWLNTHRKIVQAYLSAKFGGEGNIRGDIRPGVVTRIGQFVASPAILAAGAGAGLGDIGRWALGMKPVNAWDEFSNRQRDMPIDEMDIMGNMTSKKLARQLLREWYKEGNP